jgi:hypothetical protein
LVFEGILASHFVGTFCPFDTLFLHPLSTAKASDDTRRKLDQRSFSPRSECYECSSSLSLSFQREREKEITTFILIYRKQKPSTRESFSTNTGCFCPKKKRPFLQIILERAKILAHKTPARFEKKNNNESAEQRERESLGCSFSRRARF